MTFDSFPLGPEMFEKAFGAKWGLRIWRVAFILVVVLFFGGVIYAATRGVHWAHSEFWGSEAVARSPEKSPQYILNPTSTLNAEDGTRGHPFETEAECPPDTQHYFGMNQGEGYSDYMFKFDGGVPPHSCFYGNTSSGGKGQIYSGNPDTPPPITVNGGQGIIVAPNNSGTVNQNNNFGPPVRAISDKHATAIRRGLKTLGRHIFCVVDYTGGTDVEAHRYMKRLSGILIAGGWTPVNGSPFWFLPAGGEPLVGIHFLFHSDVVPQGAAELSKILASNGVPVENDYIKFPMYAPTDDVIGIAVGKAPQ